MMSLDIVMRWHCFVLLLLLVKARARRRGNMQTPVILSAPANCEINTMLIFVVSPAESEVIIPDPKLSPIIPRLIFDGERK